MTKLYGVYAYELWENFENTEEVTLSPISEEAAVYRAFPNREDVNFLIARQGIVNDVLSYYPNVRWLQLLNAGFEKVDLSLLRARGIIFTNARSVYCATIAEDVIAKILFLARNYRRHFLDETESFWPTDAALKNFNIDLSGRVLGILGAGAIGSEIAARARVFGMKLRAYDPYIREKEGFDVVYGGTDGLSRLLSESDFVVTSLPVTDETRDIINEKTLGMMKKTAYLINVARGEIVDEAALCRALREGTIAGAALDVTKTEPLPKDSPLWTAGNILITPHRAAYGDKMGSRMNALIRRNIRHYLEGEPLEDRVRL